MTNKRREWYDKNTKPELTALIETYIARAEKAEAEQDAAQGTCPLPSDDDDTYYTKGKTAEWFCSLGDADFAWEICVAAQDLNDTGLADDLEKWLPVEVMLSDAADRIQRLHAVNAEAIARAEKAEAERDALLRQSDETHWDDHCVNQFAKMMRDKMAASRAKGRSGWNDPSQCSVDYLRELLYEHLDKGDPVDVANLCMMLRHYDASTARDKTRVSSEHDAAIRAALDMAARECDKHAEWIERERRQGLYSAEGCLRASGRNIRNITVKDVLARIGAA